MTDVTLGVDVSDLIARLAIVRNGDVVSRGIVAANRAGAMRDAARKALSSGTPASIAIEIGRAHV